MILKSLTSNDNTHPLDHIHYLNHAVSCVWCQNSVPFGSGHNNMRYNNTIIIIIFCIQGRS